MTEDGRTIVFLDGSVHTCDLEGGEVHRVAIPTQLLARSPGGHPFPHRLAITPDPPRAVVALATDLTGQESGEQTIAVLDLATGAPLSVLRAHTATVTDLVVLPDGDRILSASLDKTLGVWDVLPRAEGIGPSPHRASVTVVAFGPDACRLASGSADGEIRTWDPASGRELSELLGHTDGITAIAFTPDGENMVSASEDNTLRVWDLVAGRERVTLRGHTHAPMMGDAWYSPDNLAAVMGFAEQPVIGVEAVAVDRDGERARSRGKDGMVREWDLRTGEQLSSRPSEGEALGGREVCQTVSLSVDADATGLLVTDPASGGLRARFPSLETIASVAVTGWLIAAGGAVGGLYLLELREP
ncbi:MAG TPA: WD40 repeat domain-containing protein [Thermoanaerobaculia bacterium]|nr:WD40 repeat domain-containing protein [Thermoanaerobaculia bacterium]